jgi:hypothetical protein
VAKIIFLEGFDHLPSGTLAAANLHFATTNGGSSIGQSTGFSTGTGRHGRGKCLKHGGGTAYVDLPLHQQAVHTVNKSWIGFALQMTGRPSVGGDSHIVGLYTSVPARMYALVMNNLGMIGVIDNAGTIFATRVGPLRVGWWYYIELEASHSATTATDTVVVRVNGGTALTATSMKTSPTSYQGALAYLRVGNSASGSPPFAVDDIYVIGDNLSGYSSPPLGDISVDTLYTNSSPQENWTRSANSANYENVRTYDGLVTYNSQDSANHLQDDYADFRIEGATDGSFYSGRTIQGLVNQIHMNGTNSTIYDEVNNNLYGPYSNAANNPFTPIVRERKVNGDVWTQARIDAMKVGIQ